ncbi:MAG: hypothetical protein WBA75_11480 [Sphingopyxis granuli]
MFEPPEPPPAWVDGPIGLFRFAAILFAAALLGLVLAAIHNARADSPAPPQEKSHGVG